MWSNFQKNEHLKIKNEHLVQGLFNWFSFINSSFNLTQGPVIGIWFSYIVALQLLFKVDLHLDHSI